MLECHTSWAKGNIGDVNWESTTVVVIVHLPSVTSDIDANFESIPTVPLERSDVEPLTVDTEGIEISTSTRNSLLFARELAGTGDSWALQMLVLVFETVTQLGSTEYE